MLLLLLLLPLVVSPLMLWRQLCVLANGDRLDGEGAVEELRHERAA